MKIDPSNPIMILAPAVIGIWLGSWYIGLSHSDIMLATIVYMLAMLLIDPRMVISVKLQEKALRDYYVIECEEYNLKLEQRPVSDQKFFGTYRVVRGDRAAETERFGLCDYAAARGVFERLAERTGWGAEWGSPNPTEHETIMYAIHAGSIDEAVKRPYGIILHRTPREQLDRHRADVQPSLEQQAQAGASNS
jgi:hypothetical protein